MHPAIARALPRIQKCDYRGAAELLRSAGRDTSVRNTLGVCLLRLGQIDEALAVFRQFVLVPGGVTERSDVSNLCRRNFATALLLKGSPSGALAVIQETREPNHPMAVRIQQAIQSWERSLSWLRWIDWKLNRIEPPHCQVAIDFEPGEFEFDVVQRPAS
ncbi:MAG: tetratricopeptide repeat protein [Novipirellula sp. JB048]